MRNKSSLLVVLAVFSLAFPNFPAFADIQFWDPDGSTPGTSISGNWNTITPNWTASPDSGVNAVWTQGNESDFTIAANYTVTLTEPITVGNISVSGSAGTLTVSGSTANSLTLAGSAVFNTGGRNVTLSVPINGGFDLTRTGAGTITLSGASTYGGGTTVSGGTSALGVSSVFSRGVITSGPFGTGPVNISGAATMQSSGGARTLDNPITLSANLTIGGSTALAFQNGGWTVSGAGRTVTVNNTADTTLQGPLADDGASRTLTKAGAGKLIMATGDSTTSFLGGITASAGTLAAGNNTPFPTNNNNQVTLNGSILDLNGFDLTLSRLGGNATGQVLLGSKTLTAGNNASSAEFAGVISGTGGYVKVGTISEVLSGTNTFSGGITIKEGALYLSTNGLSGSAIALSAGANTITIMGTGRIGANRSAGSLSIITNNILLANVGPTAGLDPANGGTFVLSGQISGSGGLLRYSQGSGSAILAGDNTFSGGVEIDARTLGVGHKHALGNGPFTVGNPLVPPSSTIVIASTADLAGPNAITNVTTVNQSFTVFATNQLELSGPMTLATPVVVTTIGDSLITFSGIIDGPGGLTKAGTNRLVLTGANTFADVTTVNSGTLLINNISGSGTGTNFVTVNADGTLGGSGTIAGPVTVAFGGSIGAGSSAGKLTLLNGLDLSGGGTNIWELAAYKDDGSGTAGTDFDQISLAGGNLVLGGSSTASLRFIGSAATPTIGNPFWQVNHTWKCIALSGGAVNPGNSTFASIDGTNGISAGIFSTSVDASGSIILSYTAGPVPPAPVIDGNINGAGTTNAMFSWTASNGVTYDVQYKESLTDPAWTTLGSVTANGSSASFTDMTNPPADHRFYRVVVH
jgi:fibronectin-binding autotransporter adhesin